MVITNLLNDLLCVIVPYLREKKQRQQQQQQTTKQNDSTTLLTFLKHSNNITML